MSFEGKFFHYVCYYLSQNNQTIPKMCNDSSFKFDNNTITYWNYGIPQPTNETLLAYDANTISTFVKKHKIMFDPDMQTMKNIINFSTNNSILARTISDDDLVTLISTHNPGYFGF